jgi:hypothetical protein
MEMDEEDLKENKYQVCLFSYFKTTFPLSSSLNKLLIGSQ